MAIAASIVTFMLGYVLGSRYFSAEMQVARANLPTIKKSNALLAKQAGEITRLQAELEVDAQAIEHLRMTVAGLGRQISGQREELTLYRNLLKNDNVADGLHVLDLYIRAREPASYGYSFVIRQKAVMYKTLAVDYAVQISGQLGGESTYYSLADVDAEIEKSPVRTKLKYFKIIEGVMELPSEFVPDGIVISTWPAKKSSERRDVKFAWSEILKE